MRRFIPLFVLIVMPLMLVGCVSMALPKVSARTPQAAALPALDGTSRVDWEAGRAALLQQFQDEVYGAWPERDDVRLVEHEVIATDAYDGAGRIEQYTLEMGGLDTHLAVILPNHVAGPVPSIILQTFCGNVPALGWREGIEGPTTPHAQSCEEGGFASFTVRQIFGRHIMTPPVEDILDHGYALVFHYPGDIVPDANGPAQTALTELSPDAQSGGVIAWAWAYSRVVDVLEADPRFDRDRMAVWGHSRNGKSALVAAAFDDRIDLVIAHQAGTGGTTLTRSDDGESVAQITDSYPYWFSPDYAAYAGREADIPVDQHQLIALMAPRPLLIGGAWRDQWSDPGGSFRAAQGATPIYRLYGSQGLEQEALGAFQPDADLAVFMRRGLHGVNAVDWQNFLAFLDAHFTPGDADQVSQPRP